MPPGTFLARGELSRPLAHTATRQQTRLASTCSKMESQKLTRSALFVAVSASEQRDVNAEVRCIRASNRGYAHTILLETVPADVNQSSAKIMKDDRARNSFGASPA